MTGPLVPESDNHNFLKKFVGCCSWTKELLDGVMSIVERKIIKVSKNSFSYYKIHIVLEHQNWKCLPRKIRAVFQNVMHIRSKFSQI